MVGLQTWVLILTASPCLVYRAVQSPLAAWVGDRTPRQDLWHLIWVAGTWHIFFVREIMFEDFTLAVNSVLASSLVLAGGCPGVVLAGRRVLHHWWTVWTTQVAPKCVLWEGNQGLLPGLFQRYLILKRAKKLVTTSGLFSPLISGKKKVSYRDPSSTSQKQIMS